MRNKPLLNGLQILSVIKKDPTSASGYSYTDSALLQASKHGKHIKSHGGYLYFYSNYYNQASIDKLFSAFDGMTYREIALASIDGDHTLEQRIAIMDFDNSKYTIGSIGAHYQTRWTLGNLRDQSILADYDKLLIANGGKDKAKIITQLSNDYDITSTSVRRTLQEHGRLPKVDAVEYNPRYRLGTVNEYEPACFTRIEQEARQFYTRGRGATVGRVPVLDGAGNFSIDSALLLKYGEDSAGKYAYMPDTCPYTGEWFSLSSLEGDEGRALKMHDIVIGRVDPNKPAHGDNLKIMSFIARAVIEGHPYASPYSKKPWEKFEHGKCTKEKWEAAIAKVKESLGWK